MPRAKRCKVTLYVTRPILDDLREAKRASGRSPSDLLIEAWERAREVIRAWRPAPTRIPHPQGGEARLAAHERDREDREGRRP